MVGMCVDMKSASRANFPSNSSPTDSEVIFQYLFSTGSRIKNSYLCCLYTTELRPFTNSIIHPPPIKQNNFHMNSSTVENEYRRRNAESP